MKDAANNAKTLEEQAAAAATSCGADEDVGKQVTHTHVLTHKQTHVSTHTHNKLKTHTHMSTHTHTYVSTHTHNLTKHMI